MTSIKKINSALRTECPVPTDSTHALHSERIEAHDTAGDMSRSVTRFRSLSAPIPIDLVMALKPLLIIEVI